MKINELRELWRWWLRWFVEHSILRPTSERLNVFVMRNEQDKAGRCRSLPCPHQDVCFTPNHTSGTEKTPEDNFVPTAIRLAGHPEYLDERETKWQKTGENCNARSFINCTPLNIIEMIRSDRRKWAGPVAHMGEIRNVLKILIVKSEGNGSLEIHRRNWEDNIKMDLMDSVD
jgi:hypothetical protein